MQWEPVGTFIDIGQPLALPATQRPERTKALEMVESGTARGIVVPTYVMLWHFPSDLEAFTAWQDKTGSWVSSPWNTVALDERIGTGRLRPSRAVS
ncbi:hypothetical protein [Streptomyces endophyticus]|uniref:Uncharacterized protein n=1 Tax=Streptomyces endophyticus TaxID=714166 RepID=A0ABU6F715_9ACTN|nr:hypothetical protein [Streptomyces endophyticus]MEB8339768.1 hypothetical protein [Streptomyces endophyticus]